MKTKIILALLFFCVLNTNVFSIVIPIPITFPIHGGCSDNKGINALLAMLYAYYTMFFIYIGFRTIYYLILKRKIEWKLSLWQFIIRDSFKNNNITDYEIYLNSGCFLIINGVYIFFGIAVLYGLDS